jgi:hypothetical protein
VPAAARGAANVAGSVLNGHRLESLSSRRRAAGTAATLGAGYARDNTNRVLIDYVFDMNGEGRPWS